jgi:hypothetical protein
MLQHYIETDQGRLAFFFFDGTSSEGGELPHCIKGRGKMVQLIRKTEPKNHTSTVN